MASGAAALDKLRHQRVGRAAHRRLAGAVDDDEADLAALGLLVLGHVADQGVGGEGRVVAEHSIDTEDGRLRPDAVIRIPGQKSLIVDAKVSLNAYTRYVNAEDDLERKQALREQRGGMFVVSSTELRYLQPARLDDALEVTAGLHEAGRASMVIAQQAWRGDQLLCEGTIRIGWVDVQTLRPGRIPNEILEALR